MSIEGCPHGPIIGGSVCVECATRREKDPRVAALEEQLDAFARKLVGAKSCPSCAAKDARIKELEEELAKWKVATDWAKELSETRELIARAEKAEAENERLRKVVKAGKECSKQYFFDLNCDSAEFYVAMEHLYAALKKLEEG